MNDVAPDDKDACHCAICSLKIDFDLDNHLVQEIEKHNCVIFAGSGISTETSNTHPNSLYETLKFHTKTEGDLEFWKLVDLFESQPNGRQKLIELVVDRFSYIDSFRELRMSATRFHRTLGNAPYFGTIITTNWDRYFEDIIGATPFVYDGDIPFWENANRPVLKIHGSIDNYSSIVASTEDYDACEERLREGALGAVLKQIFATKTCIFCGYSAKDQDFRRIFQAIKDGLGQFARSHYLVSPFVSDDESQELLEEFGIISIKTDGAHFVETVKSHMEGKFCFSNDQSFDEVRHDLFDFKEMHQVFVESYNPNEAPHLIYATAYQDGVIHALERIVDRELTGEFADLHSVQSKISGYEQKISECKKAKNYWDLAYFRGYQNGLISFIMHNEVESDDSQAIPECFHPGQDEIYLEEFDETIRKNPEIHKLALKKAKKLTERFSGDDDVVVQHLPWG